MTAPKSPPDATAEGILDATLHVIGQRGLKGATTRAIAQQAGVHEMTLFRKFGTKTGLIQAAIARQFATVERLGVQYTGDIEADLLKLAQVFGQTLQAVGPVARVLLTEAPLDPELAGSMDAPRQLFAAIAALLTRYQQEGQLHPEPAATLIPAFIGPIALPYLLPDARLVTGEAIAHSFDAHLHVSRFLHGRACEATQGDQP